MGYSRTADPEVSARAFGREMPISYKHAVEICRHIRGMPLVEAKEELKAIIEMRKPLPLKKYRGSAGHKKGIGGPGRFPVKAARAILRTLENAEANAEVNLKSVDPEDLYVWHIAASKGMTFESYFPRAHGRTTPKRRETVNVEVILKIMEEEE